MWKYKVANMVTFILKRSTIDKTLSSQDLLLIDDSRTPLQKKLEAVCCGAFYFNARLSWYRKKQMEYETSFDVETFKKRAPSFLSRFKDL